MKIFAIGGGEIQKDETLEFDRYIVELTGIHRPNALFLPTASGDSKIYAETFKNLYGRRLGCKVNVLRLISEAPSRSEILQKIHSANLIYVGGGNTLRMMKRWRALSIDGELSKAGARGAVLAGLSAGAICWFRYGNSDSRSFSGKKRWQHIRVRGLG